MSFDVGLTDTATAGGGLKNIPSETQGAFPGLKTRSFFNTRDTRSYVRDAGVFGRTQSLLSSRPLPTTGLLGLPQCVLRSRGSYFGLDLASKACFPPDGRPMSRQLEGCDYL